MVKEEVIPLNFTYGDFENEYPIVASSLPKCSLEHCLAILGSMLTLPEFQSNACRLELLVHLVILNAIGKSHPTQAQVVAWFNQLNNGACGQLEDPAEDIFLSRVTTKYGDYRLFEGSAEGNNFYTRIFLSILENAPENDSFQLLKEAVISLLQLSDKIAERTGAPVHCVGNPKPLSNIEKPSKRLWSELRKRVTFTFDDLREIGVNPYSLKPFLIRPNDTKNLRLCRIGHSPLDFKPIYPTSNGLIVFQPGFIGTAIRYFIIKCSVAADGGESLHKKLAHAYAEYFVKDRLFLDSPIPYLKFQRYDGFYASETVKEIDAGRYLHLLFFIDGFKDFEKNGFTGTNPIEKISKHVEKSTDRIQKTYSVREGFRKGLTLVISCGWGRNMTLCFDKNTAGWRTEVVPGHDITILNRTPSFQSLDLIKVLDAEDMLGSLNIELLNANGFLNLFAWINDNDGHIFPHEEMSKILPAEQGFFAFNIPSNCNLRLRQDSYLAADIRTLPRPDGSIAKLRRMYGAPKFGTKDFSPLYIDTTATEDIFRAAFIGKGGIYWVEARISPELDNKTRYQLADMIMAWSELVFQHFDERYNICVSCCFHFLDNKIPHTDDPKLSDEEISTLVERSHQDNNDTIIFNIKKGFFSASYRPDNLAEQAIVRALVESCFEAFAESPNEDEIGSAISAVVKTNTARHFHVFSGTLPRDFIREDLPKKVQTVKSLDDANARLGLGWLCRDPSNGGNIEGLDECRDYLAKLREALIEKYKVDIAQFDKQTLVEQLLRNHEVSLHEIERWHRTYNAVAGLSDEAQATGEALQDIKRYEAASTFSRIAIEAAICECPLNGGLNPGRYDIAQLLAYASIIHYIGQCFMVMNAGMMEPRIEISAAGEVMMNHDFSDEIVQPYGEFIQTTLFKNATQKYPENYATQINVETDSHTEESIPHNILQFEQAWHEEYEFTLKDLQTFINGIGKFLEKERKAVLRMKRSDIIKKLHDETDISPKTIADCIEAFSSVPRNKWNASPEGYMDSAWHPWRFRRHLSLFSRPIIQLENTDDPDCLIAPAMIVQFIPVFVSNVYRGAFDPRMFQKNGLMYKLIGRINKEQGEAFNEKVATKFRNIGWAAQANLLDDQILKRCQNDKFGDVDVLAWNDAQKRVLVIECKDLLFDKTTGEIANRLANFRGLTKANGKRDDLKKHLDRCEDIEANIIQLSEFVKFRVKRIDKVLIFSQITPVQFSKIDEEFSITICTFDEIEKMFEKN